MNTQIFIEKIKSLSNSNDLIKLYPLDSTKALTRFWARIFWLPEINEIKRGWLNNLYSRTNGIDLSNYYIVPYNTYFNKKSQSFDEFCREWIINQENANEILADFYAFMTDRHSLVGFLGNLKNSEGKNFIAYSKPLKGLKDINIIFSSIDKLYDYVIETLSKGEMLDFSHPIEFWIARDVELKNAYELDLIIDYKLRFLYQNDSDIYRKLKKV